MTDMVCVACMKANYSRPHPTAAALLRNASEAVTVLNGQALCASHFKWTLDASIAHLEVKP